MWQCLIQVGDHTARRKKSKNISKYIQYIYIYIYTKWLPERSQTQQTTLAGPLRGLTRGVWIVLASFRQPFCIYCIYFDIFLDFSRRAVWSPTQITQCHILGFFAPRRNPHSQEGKWYDLDYTMPYRERDRQRDITKCDPQNIKGMYYN